MIEVGRSEKIIKEMDQLASENHTYKATKAEIDVNPWQLVDLLERGEFRYDADKAST